jgi:SAM-dependent methyltransferase
MYYDAIVATLAEHDSAQREAIAVVGAFASQAPHETRHRFSDDWTAHEKLSAPAPAVVSGATRPAFRRWQSAAEKHSPAAWLDRKVTAETLVVEIGCGAGERSEVLASKADRLLVADVSLRAVMAARARASRCPAEVAGVVMDAQGLPLKKGSTSLMVAEHLVDLLDEPSLLFKQAYAALKPQGRLLLTTSEPSLGTDDDAAVSHVSRAAGFQELSTEDGLAWLRVNSSRFVEVYWVKALELRRSRYKLASATRYKAR